MEVGGGDGGDGGGEDGGDGGGSAAEGGLFLSEGGLVGIVPSDGVVGIDCAGGS